MIRFALQARRDVRELSAYYRRIGRPEAVANLNTALLQAVKAIESGIARPRPYSATYSELSSFPEVWLKAAHVGTNGAARADAMQRVAGFLAAMR